jgi:hypothetical protein
MESELGTRFIRGLLLLTGTVAVQVAAQGLLNLTLAHWRDRRPHFWRLTPPVLPSAIAVLILLLGHLAQVTLWALDYMRLGDFKTFSDAAYFSLASFTTVGANDLQLPPANRMLGAIEAALGMMMFGWSTALLVALVNRFERRELQD